MSQKKRAGPGRPRIFNEPVYLAFWVEREVKELFYELKGSKAPGEFLEMLLHSKDTDKAVLMRENAESRDEIERLKLEIEKRDKLIEKLVTENEKLRLRLEAYEKGRAAVTSRGSKIIDALASAFEEGKTWAQVCEEVGIFTPQEQVEILNKFFVTKDDSGKFAKVFRPLKGARKFKGWILIKGNAESIVDYVLARDDTLKAAQSLKRVEVEREEARAISIEQAKVDLRGKFFIIYSTYQKYLEAGKEKEALKYLQDVQDGFEKLVEKYGLDLIEDVVNEDFRFVELFGSLLSALKALKKKKPVEVKA